ncbi:MAG: MarC family protein [Kiritimatiellia bacterium]|nr:MarC family protein [Kiritimatiellia bacterium]
MSHSYPFFVSVWMKFFFLFTPFFALSMFLSMTGDYTEKRRRRLALMISVAVAVLCIGLLFLGNQIFSLFGITLNAFRVGVGVLLFLSAVSLVQGRKAPPDANAEADIAVVPLAMPVIVGPATTGTLLVMGAGLGDFTERVIGSLALLLAVACLGVMLLLGTAIERGIGHRGLNILSKLTGIILAALAAQMIMDGVLGFLAASGPVADGLG